jgi:hypothetical protein
LPYLTLDESLVRAVLVVAAMAARVPHSDGSSGAAVGASSVVAGHQ